MCVKSIPYFILSCVFAGSLCAQNRVGARDIRSLGMGQTTIGTQSWLFPASVAAIENTVYIGYQSRFAIKELSIMSIGSVFNTSFLNIGLQAGTYGFNQFRELKTGLTLAGKLTDKIYLGTTVQIHTISSAAQTGNTYFVYPDIGIEYHLNEQLRLGLALKSIARATINNEFDEKNTVSIQTGFSYSLAKECLIAAEIEPNSGGKICWRTGIEYRMIEEFAIRAGYSSFPSLPSVGIGYELNDFSLDVAAEQHQQLGVSVSVGLGYVW